jgi:hypothetical protein
LIILRHPIREFDLASNYSGSPESDWGKQGDWTATQSVPARWKVSQTPSDRAKSLRPLSPIRGLLCECSEPTMSSHKNADKLGIYFHDIF